jgi:hypothetical protein
MYKSSLVPVDLAEADMADPAIAAAVSFARTSGGAVRLVYVRSLVPITYMEFVPADFDAEQQEDAEAKLAAIAAGIDLPEAQVSAKVLIGSVHGEVLAAPMPPRSCGAPNARFSSCADAVQASGRPGTRSSGTSPLASSRGRLSATIGLTCQ